MSLIADDTAVEMYVDDGFLFGRIIGHIPADFAPQYKIKLTGGHVIFLMKDQFNVSSIHVTLDELQNI